MALYPDISQIRRIGIVGAENMGTMMSFGFSENGLDVSVWDISEKNIAQARATAGQTKTLKGKIDCFKEVHEFTKSLDSQSRRIFVFSIRHAWPTDSVLQKIRDDFKPGDIILDGGHEHYRKTERRQRELEPKGIKWLGMGVSDGYQAARSGPSMSLGGDRDAAEFVLPLLEKISAKYAVDGKPCVQYVGPRGAGHYIKMVHNGIESGMLSAVCEAWGFLNKSLGLSYDEIGEIFKRWNSEGALENTYLIQIGAEVCQRRKAPEGEGKGIGGYVLDDILDKVVEDEDSPEGTLYWTVMDAANRHVSAPTIAAGQFFRVASANRAQRLKVVDALKLTRPRFVDVENIDDFVEALGRAVYVAFLCSFCQGLELIARASKDEGWDVNLGKCIQVWRAGCIIQEGHIADMLEPILLNAKEPIMNMKLIHEVAFELGFDFDALKQITLRAIEWDNYVPALSASLEYLKYVGGAMLPTQFMEAEMDFFGAPAWTDQT
ncbi:6-phosphogluconate dehydrogenase, decarboxylating [Xylariaceae sp. FL0662B]|nr:6-phosphogluconate dehydrogenase, decarboxylating [Xylariaceae sp. FL0662B]